MIFKKLQKQVFGEIFTIVTNVTNALASWTLGGISHISHNLPQLLSRGVKFSKNLYTSSLLYKASI